MAKSLTSTLSETSASANNYDDTDEVSKYNKNMSQKYIFSFFFYVYTTCFYF